MALPSLDYFGNQSGLQTIFTVAAFVIGMITLCSKYESMNKESKSSQPYSNFGNPKKSLLDKLAGFACDWLIPFNMLTSLSHKASSYVGPNSNQEDRSILDFVRKRLIMIEMYAFHWPSCMLWNRMLRKKNDNDFLVGGTVMVSRNSSILSELGVQKNVSSVAKMMDGEYPVEVEITCPMSVIQGGLTITEKGFGYEKFKTCKLEDINLVPTVPIILYFHGGGFATGGARDVFPYFVQSLLSHQCKVNRKEGKKVTGVPPIIVASVKYRLCPENPFPSGAIDCLSAAKAFIEQFPKADIHVCGFSAGGNLSTMVGFELVRKFPGRLKRYVIVPWYIVKFTRHYFPLRSHNLYFSTSSSIVALQPVLLPRANTVSSHMNSVSSKVLTPAALRWFWASYLQFDVFNEKDNSNEIASHTLFQLGSIGAINPMLRICYPQVDIPYQLKNESAPRIFVTTGSADPLRDDGDDLVETLEQHAIAVHAYESFGSHALALLLDLSWKKKFTQEWSQCIWP